MIVTLTADELRHAGLVGVNRRVAAIENNRHDRYGFTGDYWSHDIDGAMSELAVAKATGRYWTGALGDPAPGDVGTIEVRSSRHPGAHLVVHQADGDDVPFVLVVVDTPTFHVVGWRLGRDCKQQAWWRSARADRQPAYWVPQGSLWPMEMLTKENV